MAVKRFAVGILLLFPDTDFFATLNSISAELLSLNPALTAWGRKKFVKEQLLISG
ncbi:hypothetical protein D3C78_1864220 [compost metagenome]